MKRRTARQIPESLVVAVLFALSVSLALPLARWMMHEFPAWNRFAVKVGVLVFVVALVVALIAWLNREPRHN